MFTPAFHCASVLAVLQFLTQSLVLNPLLLASFVFSPLPLPNRMQATVIVRESSEHSELHVPCNPVNLMMKEIRRVVVQAREHMDSSRFF